MSTVSMNTFLGLNLRDDVQEIPGAMDLLNVDLDRQGKVRVRDGSGGFYTTSPAALPYALAESMSDRAIVIGYSTTSKVVDSNGSLLATSAALASTPVNYVNFGSPPTGNVLYGGVGTATTTLFKWNGAALSYPVTNYSARYVSTWQTRLVLGQTLAGIDASPSRVRFSDAGLPETYTANNYVDLDPGDGEDIRGLQVWKNQLFVFKETKFYVFYGTSTDSTGQPVFNYRTVNTGIGIDSAGLLSAAYCASPEGVYFLGQDGIYRTTGGPPQKLSTAVDPLFRALSVAGYNGPTIDRANPISAWLCAFRSKVILAFRANGSSSRYALVFDTDGQFWTLWDFGTYSPMAIIDYRGPATVGAPASTLMFVNSDGAVSKLDASSTTDAGGAAIVSRYRTGFLDFGAPEQEKWIRQMMLSGTGTVNVKTAVNDAATLSSATSVALGTSPAVGTGRWSSGTRGRNISVDVSATSGQWSLSHLSLDVGGIRAPGVRAA